MSDPLEILGLSREELQASVVDRIASLVLAAESEEGDAGVDFAEALQEHIRTSVNAKVAELAQARVAPNVNAIIEGIALQRTNEWGEKRGASQTFVEYLIERADAYMREQVDSDGRSQEECRSRGNSWYNKNQTRVSYMIDKYLSNRIGDAMTVAFKELNSSVAKGLEETIKLKLAEVLTALKVTVATR